MNSRNRLYMGVDEQVIVDIEEIVKLYEKKAGIKISRANVVVSALRLGLKTIKDKLNQI